ncbi:PIR protein [Plasmodium yoelii yoelii]|uniref:PIR protein n=2 Tax=Plasmodium yoelii yoelii TaxID=73239 RepID=A0AAF0AYB8_PLAYO|nr:PIR protein [Plasmodium yoelii yoelii]
MGDKRMCELFLEGDKLFNEEKVNENKFNSNIRLYQEYCRNKSCTNNNERINALGGYLFKELTKINKDKYSDYFAMWVSDKLYRLENSNTLTLKESYEKHLNKYIGNNNYWATLDNVKGLKDANLRHMRELYTLLSHICNTIANYKTKGANSKDLYIQSYKCLNQYRNLHNNVSKCNSYLYLLDKLKKTYEDFRTFAINENKKTNKMLDKRLQTLTTIARKNSYFAPKNTKFNFNDPGCSKLHSQTAQLKEPQPKGLQSKGPQLKQPQSNQLQHHTSVPSSHPARSPPLPPSKPLPPLPPSKPSPPSARSPPSKPSPQPKLKAPSATLPQPELKEPSATLPQPELKEPSETSTQTELKEPSETSTQTKLKAPLETSTQTGPTAEPQTGPTVKPQTGPTVEPQTGSKVEQQIGPKQETQPVDKQETLLKKEPSIEQILKSEILSDLYKVHLSSFYKNLTKYGNRIYESASTSLTKGYSAFNDFANDVLTRSNNELDTSQSGDNNLKLGISEIDLPSSGSPSETIPTSLPPEQPLKETYEESIDTHDTEELPNEEHVEGNVQMSDIQHSLLYTQELPSNPIVTLAYQRSEPTHSGKNINEILLKSVISVIAIAIPVILLVMYKYLAAGWRKKLKRKKNKKKVANLCDKVNREM